ncbi:MAG: molybdate ABC transporter substrate-binding protein [Ancalomicrobiaceae bacterium]|nr:molybdate ABC transporter substrate-binding protein [Ancalomicrobiaceae bacterium]
MMRRSFLAAAVAGMFSALCLSQPAAADSRPLTVFAAASLKNALDDVAAGWVAGGHAKPAISYAASGPLAKQIEAGAPADIFISADLAWMDYAESKNLVDKASRFTLLGNDLVLIVPKASTATFKIAPNAALADLVGADGRLAVGEPKSVPAGKYAQDALQKLGIWDSVKGRLAYAESVRAALQLVARGEAPAGIVYKTDAFADPGVKILDTFPEDSHAPVVYPAALVTGASNPDSAGFLAYLRGPEAKAAFEKQGFAVIAK